MPFFKKNTSNVVVPKQLLTSLLDPKAKQREETKDTVTKKIKKKRKGCKCNCRPKYANMPIDQVRADQKRRRDAAFKKEKRLRAKKAKKERVREKKQRKRDRKRMFKEKVKEHIQRERREQEKLFRKHIIAAQPYAKLAFMALDFARYMQKVMKKISKSMKPICIHALLFFPRMTAKLSVFIVKASGRAILRWIRAKTHKCCGCCRDPQKEFECCSCNSVGKEGTSIDCCSVYHSLFSYFLFAFVKDQNTF